MVAALRPERSIGRLPIFDTLFVLQDQPFAAPAGAGLELDVELLPTGASPFTLVFQVESHAARGLVEYASDRFDPASIDAMIDGFMNIASDVAANPDRIVGDLPQLMPADRARILEWGNVTAGSEDCPDQLLHAAFERHARATPEAIAIRGTTPFSYGALDRAASALADSLRKRGVTADRLVGIAIARSAEAVIAMLAVMKAGGAYLPIDPAWPRARRDAIVADAQPDIVLELGDVQLAPDEPSAPEWRTTITPNQLAYVLYTSGSTGTPRGVMIEHAAIANQLRWRQAAFPLAPSDIVLASSPLTFDPSVWEIFGPLSQGASIVMAPGATHEDWGAERNTITTLQLVPAALRALLDQNALGDLHALRRVYCGGESLDVLYCHHPPVEPSGFALLGSKCDAFNHSSSVGIQYRAPGLCSGWSVKMPLT